MGYYTYVNGELTIDPPLSWEEIKDSPFYQPKNVDRYDFDKQVVLVVEEESRETPEGTLVVRTASTLESTWDDRFKAYSLEDHVREFLRLYGEGHTITGTLHCTGEENDDIWRIEVEGNQSHTIRSVVVWPEDMNRLSAAVRAAVQTSMQSDSAGNQALGDLVAAVRQFLGDMDRQFQRADR